MDKYKFKKEFKKIANIARDIPCDGCCKGCPLAFKVSKDDLNNECVVDRIDKFFEIKRCKSCGQELKK